MESATSFYIEIQNPRLRLNIIMAEESLSPWGGIFANSGRARAYTHVLARAYSTRASMCILYTCLSSSPHRLNTLGRLHSHRGKNDKLRFLSFLTRLSEALGRLHR